MGAKQLELPFVTDEIFTCQCGYEAVDEREFYRHICLYTGNVDFVCECPECSQPNPYIEITRIDEYGNVFWRGDMWEDYDG